MRPASTLGRSGPAPQRITASLQSRSSTAHLHAMPRPHWPPHHHHHHHHRHRVCYCLSLSLCVLLCVMLYASEPQCASAPWHFAPRAMAPCHGPIGSPLRPPAHPQGPARQRAGEGSWFTAAQLAAVWPAGQQFRGARPAAVTGSVWRKEAQPLAACWHRRRGVPPGMESGQGGLQAG